jgi:hypothetical protein
MRQERQRLQDIAQAAAAIAGSIEGMTAKRFAAAFTEDSTFADALSYRLVVIGEAINALLGDAAQGRAGAPVIAAHPQIDWAGYAALRHILAHQYFRRDPARIWTAITEELPALHDLVSRELDRQA